MKELKILTVNERKESMVTEKPFFIAYEKGKTEEYIQEYLNDGWKITSCFPVVNPSIQGEGGYNFYRGGITFILEREI